MAARGSVGTGYIDVVPRLGSDWGRELTRRMQEGAGGAGDQAGRESGDRFSSGFLARFRAGPFQALGGTIGRTIAAGAAAAGGIGIGKLLADSVANASDLNETISKVGVVFGTASAGVLEFGRTAAAALGQSRAQALEATGTIGNLFVSMGLGQQKAADMSMSMVKLATDFASFNNASPEEALDAIKAALIGENDPIQRFGVLLNEAAIKAEALRLGLIKGKEAVTPAIQAQAAYSLILAQSGTAQDDFARTSDGLANQQRILKAEFLDLSAKVGAIFLPMVTRVVSKLGDMVGAIPKIASEIGGKLKPAFDAGRLGLSAFVAAFRGGDVTSGGFVGQMQKIGSAAREFVPKLAGVGKSLGAGLMPALRDVGDFITKSLWPTLKNIGAIFVRLAVDVRPLAVVVGGVLLVALRAAGVVLANVIGPVLSGLTGFIRSNQTALTALAVAVGAGVVAFYAYQAAVVAVSWATYLWESRTVLMGAAMRAVRGAIVAMRAAVLALNTAFWANPIGLVIAALIALAAGFVYLWKHSESFRNFWKAVWDGIKTATLAVVDALVAAYKWVVGALEWVGQKASAFFGFYIGIWRGGFNFVSGLISGWIAFAKGIFEAGFGAIKAFFEIWWTVISTVFRVAFEVIRGIIRFFINIFQGDWKGAWNAISDTTHKVLDIVRGAIDRVLGAIRGAFETAVRGIGAAWDGIKRVAAAPVNFVIDVVYNRGIRPAFNFVAGLIGVGKLPEAQPIRFRRGGRLPGYGGGDILPALLEPGETVVDKDRTRMLAPIFAAAGVPGFALGGLVGKVWDATGGRVVSGIADLAGNAVDWVRGALGSGLDAALGPVRALIRGVLGTGEGWKGWLGKLALKPLEALVQWVKGKDEAAMAGVGGGSPGSDTARKAMGIVQAMAASMYGWVGAQWTALKNLLMGESGFNPFAVNRSSGAAGIFQSLGHGPVPLGNAAAQAAWGLPYIKGRYGTPVNAYATWLSRRPHWYDVGGGKAWPTGTVGVNTSGETEYVWRASQLRASGGGVHYHVHMHGTVVIGGNRESAAREFRSMLKDSLRGDGKHEAASML